MTDPREEAWPFVYVMARRSLRDKTYLGLCKVGFSRDPENRVATVRAVLPPGILVTLEHKQRHESAEFREKEAHRLLRAYAEGGEWFACSIEQAIEAVTKACAKPSSPRKRGVRS